MALHSQCEKLEVFDFTPTLDRKTTTTERSTETKQFQTHAEARTSIRKLASVFLQIDGEGENVGHVWTTKT